MGRARVPVLARSRLCVCKGSYQELHALRDHLGRSDRGTAALYARSELDALGDSVQVLGVTGDDADHEVSVTGGRMGLDDLRN